MSDSEQTIEKYKKLNDGVQGDPHFSDEFKKDHSKLLLKYGNPLVELRRGLQSVSNEKIGRTDVADVLGYGHTQVKDYFKHLNLGTVGDASRENEIGQNFRLERAATIACALGDAVGYDKVFKYKFFTDRS